MFNDWKEERKVRKRLLRAVDGVAKRFEFINSDLLQRTLRLDEDQANEVIEYMLKYNLAHGPELINGVFAYHVGKGRKISKEAKE